MSLNDSERFCRKSKNNSKNRDVHRPKKACPIIREDMLGRRPSLRANAQGEFFKKP